MKLKGRFQHLGTQLIVFYMIISLIVLSIASYFIYFFMLGIIKDNNETLLLQQFRQLDHNIEGLINDVDSLSKLFLLDASVQRFLDYSPDKGKVEFLEMKSDLHMSIDMFISNYDYINSIYIVGDVQGIVGGTNTKTLIQSNEKWITNFIDSDIITNSHRNFPDLVLEGGRNKSYYNPYILSHEDGKIISIARGVRPLYQSQTRAVLILNIDEKYVSSIYSTALEADRGKMYIVDKNGIIISSSNVADIGSQTQSPDLGKADYGSYDIGNTITPMQTVYYRLINMNWYMLKEIPLNQFSEQIYSMQSLLVIVFMASLIVIFVVSYFWLKKMTRPLHILAHKMKDMSRGELGITFPNVPNNEFGVVIRRFNEMSLSIVDLIKENNEMQEMKRELEIDALQNQINPHFLYNTLNMIRWMASIIKADNIVNSIVALGNILRPAFASKDSMCTLRDELHYLENYIKIINLRFSNCVVFSIHVDEIYLGHQIPRFILQPIVENSITFGKSDDGHPIQIRIEVYEEEDDIIISVIDTGEGIDPDKLNQLNEHLQMGVDHSNLKGTGNGVGLYNVNKRIQLNYGMQYGIRLVPKTKGIEVLVLIPMEKELT